MSPKLPTVLALVILTVVATLFGCGCGDGNTTPRTGTAVESHERDSPRFSEPETAKAKRRQPPASRQETEPQSAQAPKTRQGTRSAAVETTTAEDKEDAKPHRQRSRGQGDISDKDACAQDPSLCESPEAQPDSSNPDVREAEAKGQSSSGSAKCHSRDCEEALSASG